MKRFISIMLVASMLSASGYCAKKSNAEDVSSTVRVVSPEVIAELNKALPKEPETKMTTGGWIWLGVIVVVGAIFGSIAVNSASNTPSTK